MQFRTNGDTAKRGHIVDACCVPYKRFIYNREHMGTLPISKPITVEEYERIPNPPDGWYELHHGELVLVTRPVRQHWDLQRRLRKLLEPMAEPMGYIADIEYAYRPLPDNEVWGADVICISGARHAAVAKWLDGSPELVIEVKSPSNSNAELNDKAMTTLAGTGASEFWIVDPVWKSVTVISKSSGRFVYDGNAAVPVVLFGGRIHLTELFTGL